MAALYSRRLAIDKAGGTLRAHEGVQLERLVAAWDGGVEPEWTVCTPPRFFVARRATQNDMIERGFRATRGARDKLR